MIFSGADHFICNHQRFQATSDWKDLRSTNYPENYEDNEDCGVLIESEVGSVLLEIVDFHLEEKYDKLRIYDGIDDKAELLETYNGQVESGSVKSSGSSLYVKYTTDGSTTFTGFHMRFKYAS